MHTEKPHDPARPGPACLEFDQRLVLYAAGELDEAGSAAVEAHLRQCPACAASLEAERSLLELVASVSAAAPATGMLANSRAELADALDDADERRPFVHWIGSLVPSSWLSLHPAWGAVLLLVLGFSLGTFAPHWLRPAVAPSSSPALPTNNAAVFDPQEMRSADISGINWTPGSDSAAPQVQVQLTSQQPMVIQGTVDNDNVKQVLCYVLRNNTRFSPDVRLDSVELLRQRSNDADVRQALCQAVHTDHNPAVRLKALEALQGAEPLDLVRQTLVDALLDDSNTGVRIEAINTLRGLARQGKVLSDPRVVEVLRERTRKDPNAYIRIESAAAIRDLGPPHKY
jgi:hypothetical protein